MRYAEISALPAAPEEANNTIINMVTMASSKNKPEIPMEEMLGVLRSEGFDLTPRMVMDVLQGNKLITKVSKNTIHLANDGSELGMIPDQQEEKSQKHVEKMAKQTIKKNSRKK